MDYDSYKRIRKPTTKGTVILNGKIKRIKDREREEIEEGILEWEEYERKSNERNNYRKSS